MVQLKFRVRGRELVRLTYEDTVVEGSQNDLFCAFEFDGEDFDGQTKIANFVYGDFVIPQLIRDDGTCEVPPEVIRPPGFSMTLTIGNLITIKPVLVQVTDNGLPDGVYPPVVTLDLYGQMLEAFGDKYAETKAEADRAETQAGIAADQATAAGQIKADCVAIQADVAEIQADVTQKRDEVEADRAEVASDKAEADAAKTEAQQALADLLKMLGVDIATLVGGKIPMSQIPATATQEIYEVQSEDELTGLVAQRGDLAELVELVDGEKTIIKAWQLLGDAANRENWIVWGTSYAVQAGSATTAANAENAAMINNHRLVAMTPQEYGSAVIDPETYYAVYDRGTE